jgi:hypothetical protein
MLISKLRVALTAGDKGVEMALLDLADCVGEKDLLFCVVHAREQIDLAGLPYVEPDGLELITRVSPGLVWSIDGGLRVDLGVYLQAEIKA